MNILLNGAPKNLAHPLSITELLEELGYNGKRIAVERNGDIVPKAHSRRQYSPMVIA